MTQYEREKIENLICGMSEEEKEVAYETLEEWRIRRSKISCIDDKPLLDHRPLLIKSECQTE